MARRVSDLTRGVPPWLNGILIAGSLLTLLFWEVKRPLRREREDKLSRNGRNLAVGLVAAATVLIVEKPVATPLALAVERRRWGLLKRLRLPVAAELLLSVVLLDYTLFIWHCLTHKVPLLWRFHEAHHADLDMDASTGLRFHPGELALSVPWRAAQIRVLGVSPLALALWQTLTLLAILFHHSNLQLPAGFERLLCRFIVTPRMHGIHHSMVRAEADSNWSTIFSWPDRLHRTLRLNPPPQGIIIGVPRYQDPATVGFGRFLALPFSTQRSCRQPLSPPTPVLERSVRQE